MTPTTPTPIKQTVKPRFARRIQAHVAYWQGKTRELTDDQLSSLQNERSNIFRAITFGLTSPAAVPVTLQLIHQLFPFIERLGHWTEWHDILNRALPLADESLQLALRNQLGFLCRLQRDLETALVHHRMVIAAAIVDTAVAELITAHLESANAYYWLHDYGRAVTNAQTALTLCQNRTDLPQYARKMATALNIQGLVAHHRGQYEQAITLFNKALDHWADTEERLYRARTWNNLGWSLTNLEQYDDALLALDRALAELDGMPLGLDYALIQLNRGNVFYLQDQYDRAEDTYKQGDISLLRYTGELYVQANLYTNLGHVFMKKGQPDTAVAYLEESITLWRQAKDEVRLGNALGALARVRGQQDKRDEALALLAEALSLLAKYPENKWGQDEYEMLQTYRRELLNCNATESN